MNQALDDAIQDLLDDEKEFSYVIATDDPTFKQFGLSNFTSGQLYQFLQTDNTISIPNMGTATDPLTPADGEILPFNAMAVLEHILTPRGGGKVDPVTQQPDPNGVDINPDWYENPDFPQVPAPGAPPLPKLGKGASFIRFDVLTRLDELEELTTFGGGLVWSSARYSKLEDLVLETPDGWAPTDNGLKAVIGMNDEQIAGRLYVATGSETETANKPKMAKRQFLHDVTTGMSGCVSWSTPIGFNFGGQCTPSQVVDFKLYVFDHSQVSNSNRRIASRGNPLIVTTPVTAHGIPYAGGKSTSSGKKGELPAVETGGDNNPNNITTGELETSYNPNTGKFEAGTTQILARLLTDVAAVAINQLDTGSLADSLTEEDWGPHGNYALGHFTVGEAMPMGVHNGNPYDFGPFPVGDACNENVKHKIRVVNRCPKPFPKGQIVMCSKIDNEWIIMDFGYKDTDENFFETGNWRFCTMIANKDAYFKDERHTYDPIDQDGYGTTITEDKYQAAFRWQWWNEQGKTVTSKKVSLVVPSPTVAAPNKHVIVYRHVWDHSNRIPFGHDSNRIVGANGMLQANGKFDPNPNIFGSRRYHQVSSFDFMHLGGGGFRGQASLSQCNPFISLDGSQPDKPAEQLGTSFFPMFGPVFPDGFNSDQIALLDDTAPQKQGMSYELERAIPNKNESALINPYPVPANSPRKVLQLTPRSPGFLPEDDVALYQLPADVGHNAKPYSDNGSPLDDQNMMLKYCNVVTQNSMGGKTVEQLRLENEGNSEAEDVDKPSIGGSPAKITDGVKRMFEHTTPSEVRHTQRHQSRWQWYGKTGEGATSLTPSTSQSAWGLKPNNTNKITFMPLALESLTSFDYVIGTGYYMNGGSPSPCSADNPTGETLRSYLHSRAFYPGNCSTVNGAGQFDLATNLIAFPAPQGFMRSITSYGAIDYSRWLWPMWSLYRNYKNRAPWDMGAPAGPGGVKGHDYCTLAANYPYRDTGLSEGDMTAITEDAMDGGRQRCSDARTWTCTDSEGNTVSGTGEPLTGDFYTGPDVEEGQYDSILCSAMCAAGDTYDEGYFDGKPGTCCTWRQRYDTQSHCHPGDRGVLETIAGAFTDDTYCSRGRRIPRQDREAFDRCLAEHNADIDAKVDAGQCEVPGIEDALAKSALFDQNEPPKTSNYGFPYGVYVRDQHKYGNFPIQALPDGTDGVETVGIITGKTTLRVGGFEVGTVTNNYIGLPRIQASSAAVSKAYGNWGVSNDTIYSMASTVTVAKMYTAWPDEQTIFDPRYFAVMHFNPGEMYTAPSGSAKGDSEAINLGKPYIWVDAVETDVDHRIPTLYGDITATGKLDANPDEAPFQTDIYNEVIDDDTTAAEMSKWIRPDSADWKVATHRRGQLLPYSYYKRTIGLTYDWNGYHMAGSGQDYVVGDLFQSGGGQGDGALLVVTEVNGWIGNGPIGAITNFALGNNIKVKMGGRTVDPGITLPYVEKAFFPPGFDPYLNRGSEYGPRDFVTKKDYAIIKDPDNLGVVKSPPKVSFKETTRLDKKETKGRGAVIYALYGTIYDRKHTDLAPKKQASTTRISASSQNGLAGALGGREYSARLGIQSPSDDGYYDVFVHFHNDASHTTAMNYDTRYVLGHQQFINLELRGV